MLDFQCLKSPDGRDFRVPLAANPGEFYYIWNEIYGDLQIYDDEECPISQGDTVIDLGANLGIFTLRAIETFNALLVVCVEAEPQNAECLKMNLTDLGVIDKSIIINKAVYSNNEVVKLSVVSSNPGWNFVSDIFPERTADNEIYIQATTIDNLVRELRLERVDFMKFDIEGSEVNALLGAEDTIRRFKPKMAVTVYHKPEHPQQIQQLVTNFRSDYKTKLIDKGPSHVILFCR